jgi:hypothetical protein
MPGFSACAQILWNNLWITRSWLAQSQVLHSFDPVARFLTSLSQCKSGAGSTALLCIGARLPSFFSAML